MSDTENLVLTAEQMRAVESSAVRSGATWEGLMDTAGLSVAEEILAEQRSGPERAFVLCGPGNNGGDGLVVARHLAAAGWQVKVLLWRRDPLADRRLRAPLQERAVPLIEIDATTWRAAVSNVLAWCTLVVDGLFGTGLARALEGELAALVGAVNSAGKPVFAIDIASGVNSDTGGAQGAAVRATRTFALGSYKYGHFLFPGRHFAGRLTLKEIGLEADKQRSSGSGVLLNKEQIRSLLPARPLDANKGTFGKALVVAGSINYVGAAALAVQGALRSGTGLVTLGCAGDLTAILAVKLTECTFLPLPADLGAISPHAIDKLLEAAGDYNSLLVGCGLGRAKETAAFLKGLFLRHEPVHRASSRPIGFASRVGPAEPAVETRRALPALVLDGDALNILAEWEGWHESVPAGSVLTPHPGEMARLTGSSVEEVQSDRVGAAVRAAGKWNQVVVLKGAGTVIATPEGRVFVSPFATPALATAGSGDVLAGAIAGFMAQSLSPVDASCAAVYLHGMAGELLAQEYGPAGGLSGEIPMLMAKAQKSVRGD